MITARPDVFSVFPDLVTTRGLTQIEVGPLGHRASVRLLRELLEDKSAESVERVAQQAGGNPFLLEEMARAVAQGRGKELPETVLATAQARLETLPPSVRRVLRAAAVLGDALSEEGLRALLVDVTPGEMQERLRELVREEILDADSAEPGRYRFRQVVIREASYASLTEADKKLAHALAAKWLQTRGGADPLALATHLERAGSLSEACEHLIAAAEQSLEGQDFDGSLRRLARALECGAQGPRLGRIMLVKSEVYRWLGQYGEMRASAAEATKLLDESSRPWITAKVNEAMASAQLGDMKSTESLAVLLSILVEGGDVSPILLSGAARIAGNLSRYRLVAPAERLLAALSIAVQSCKDDGAVGRVWEALATDASMRHELEDALEFHESGYQCLMRAGDVRNASFARINQSFALMELGQYGRATTMLRELLAVSERHGLPPSRALSQHNLGMALAYHGETEEGAAFEREAIRVYGEQGNKRLHAASRFYLGRILIMRGELDAAESEMKSACLESEMIPSLLSLMLAGLSFVQLAAGKREQALATARDAAKRMAEREGRVEGSQTVKLALAEALVANNQSTEGAKVLGELTVEVLEQASRLRDPELRRSFLHDVKDNARAFALQASLARTE
jgi:hypothetical protein